MVSGCIGTEWYIRGERMVYYKGDGILKEIKRGYKWRRARGCFFQRKEIFSADVWATYGTLLERIRKYGWEGWHRQGNVSNRTWIEKQVGGRWGGFLVNKKGCIGHPTQGKTRLLDSELHYQYRRQYTNVYLCSTCIAMGTELIF